MRHDLIILYKILFGYVDVEGTELFNINANCTIGVTHIKLYHSTRMSTFVNIFCNRAVSSWNALPASVMKFDSLSSFKISLLLQDFSILAVSFNMSIMRYM